MQNTKHNQDGGNAKAVTEILKVLQIDREPKRPDLDSTDWKLWEAHSTDNEKGKGHPEKGRDAKTILKGNVHFLSCLRLIGINSMTVNFMHLKTGWIGKFTIVLELMPLNSQMIVHERIIRIL